MFVPVHHSSLVTILHAITDLYKEFPGLILRQTRMSPISPGIDVVEQVTLLTQFSDDKQVITGLKYVIDFNLK